MYFSPNFWKDSLTTSNFVENDCEDKLSFQYFHRGLETETPTRYEIRDTLIHSTRRGANLEGKEVITITYQNFMENNQS